MSKEYQNAMRDGFENHIAKQLRLETISKEVLAVQVFAMNANLEYVDKKLQLKWGEWEAACSQQIEKDVGICEETWNTKLNSNPGIRSAYAFGTVDCAEAIRNQGKVSLAD